MAYIHTDLYLLHIAVLLLLLLACTLLLVVDVLQQVLQ
jgi:hypothetical protein